MDEAENTVIKSIFERLMHAVTQVKYFRIKVYFKRFS